MSSLPSLLNPRPIRRHSKYFKYGILGLILVLILSLVLWLLLRYHPETSTVETFMQEVVEGHYESAYKMWQAGASYKYKDFLQDWGPTGYYGPVRSYAIVGTHEPSGASGVIVVVDVSPYRPFPPNSDFEKSSKTKAVRLWVQFSNHSLSYAP